MNKKLFGISALLALVLTACGGGNNPEPSSSDPSTGGDTSDTSTGGETTGDTSEETSEAPEAPALEEVFAAFEGLGNNHTAEISIEGVEEKLNYVKNADYVYLEGVAGVAKIELPEDAGDDEGAQQQGLARRAAVSKDNGISSVNAKASMNLGKLGVLDIERDGEGAGESDNGETGPLAPSNEEAGPKFFAIYQDKEGNFHEEWGAVYTSQEEFDHNSIVGLFEDLNKYRTAEELAEIFVNYPGETAYQVDDAETVSFFFDYLSLEDVEKALGKAFIEVGLDEDDAPFINFYAVAGDIEANARMVFKGNDTKRIAALDTYLATVTEYPTSPISFNDVMSKFMGHNYHSVADASDLVVFDEDPTFEFYATEDADALIWGSTWKVGTTDRRNLQQGVANVGEGLEISKDLYTYQIQDRNAAFTPAMVNAQTGQNYFRGLDLNKKWYEYAYCPETLFDEEYVEYTEGVYESRNAFVIDDPEAVEELYPSFRGLNAAVNFYVFGTSAAAYVPVYNSLHFAYELDDNNEVEQILVFGVVDMHSYDTKTGDVSPEVATANYAVVYEQYDNFGKVANPSTKAHNFLNGLREVSFDEEHSDKKINLGLDGEQQWIVKYIPEDTPYITYSSKDTSIVTIDSTGLVKAKGAGQTKVVATIGDATFEADVSVKGAKAYKGDEFVSSFDVAPGAGTPTEFGFELFGIENATYEIECDNDAFTVARKEFEEGQAPEGKVVYTVLANAKGTANVKFIATELDGTKYEATVVINAVLAIEFVVDDYFYGLEGGYLPFTTLAPETGATFTASADNEKVTATYDEEKGMVLVSASEACASIITVTMTVGEEHVEDTMKVSFTEKTFVGEWVYNAKYFTLDIVLHEDGTVVIYDLKNKAKFDATWTLGTKKSGSEELPAALITMNEADTIKWKNNGYTYEFQLTALYGGRGDGVACAADFSVEVKSAGYQDVLEGLIGYNAFVLQVAKYRGNYYGTCEVGVIDFYLFNDGQYLLFIGDAEEPIEGSIFDEEDRFNGSLNVSYSEDQLTKYEIKLVEEDGAWSLYLEVSTRTYNEETEEYSDWTVDQEHSAKFGKKYAII